MFTRRQSNNISPEKVPQLLEMAEAITIEDIDGRAVTLTDKSVHSEIAAFFMGMRLKKNILKAPFQYYIHILSDEQTVSFRVTKSGMILSDVPASEFQDGYLPAIQTLPELMERLLNTEAMPNQK